MSIYLVELVGSLFSFATSPLHVPIRRIGRLGHLPANEQEACRLAWEYEGDDLPQQAPGR